MKGRLVLRKDEGVQVGGEDVLPAQAEVHAQVDLVGPQRDVQAVGHRQGERHQGGTPTTEPAEARPLGRTAACGRLPGAG